jgi:hypothetical protein
MNAAKTAATALLTAAVALGATACNTDDSANVKGTVTGRHGGAPMKGKGATLIVTSKDGKTATVYIPAGLYEGCYIGASFPACK